MRREALHQTGRAGRQVRRPVGLEPTSASSVPRRGQHRALQVGICTLLLAFAGCGERGDEAAGDHPHDHGETQTLPVAFKEGHGLQIAPETARALGVRTEEIATRSIAYRTTLHASVFRAGPPALAAAFVSAETAEALKQHPPRELKIVGLDLAKMAPSGQVELALEFPEKMTVGSSLPVVLTGPANDVVAVPIGAILRSTAGTFVYVANGGAFLRTPVKLGATDDVYQEITDGVYEGDEVVVAAVEQLWLTELRLTKGGGHSH